MKKKVFLLILMLALLWTFSSARSYRVAQVPYGSTYGCNLCHTNGGGTPRNLFGSAVGSITGENNVVFWGASLAALDSDQDQFSNGIELQDSMGVWSSGSAMPGIASLVTHPGDASDYPNTTAINPGLLINFKLEKNYPNPFNPSTIISYTLPISSHVTIDIYSVLGKKVTTLVNETAIPGNYYTIWDGLDGHGNIVNSGVYLYHMKAGSFSDVKRMVFIK